MNLLHFVDKKIPEVRITSDMMAIFNSPFKEISPQRVKLLYVFNCPNLEKIPIIDGLEALYCIECPNLKEIPVINSLKSLTIRRCNNVEKIPEAMRLISLVIELPAIKEVPNIRGLLKLVVYSDFITSVPLIEGLKILHIYQCYALTKLPLILGLRELECFYCPELEEIPNFGTMRYLVCIECPKLKIVHPTVSDPRFAHCFALDEKNVKQCDVEREDWFEDARILKLCTDYESNYDITETKYPMPDVGHW